MFTEMTAIAAEGLKDAAGKAALDGLKTTAGLDAAEQIQGAVAEDMTPDVAELAAERRPEVMAPDTARRLWESGLTPEAWARADRAGRMQFLREAREIMCDEMCLSPEYREALGLRFDNLPEGTLGETTTRYDVTEDGHIILSDTNVTLEESLLASNDVTGALSTLYHEMYHAMQYESLTEAVPFSEDVLYWREDFLRHAEPHSMTSYLSNALEAGAHAQDAYFTKVYNGFGSDITAAAAEDIAKAPGAIDQIMADTISTIAGKDF